MLKWTEFTHLLSHQSVSIQSFVVNPICLTSKMFKRISYQQWKDDDESKKNQQQQQQATFKINKLTVFFFFILCFVCCTQLLFNLKSFSLICFSTGSLVCALRISKQRFHFTFVSIDFLFFFISVLIRRFFSSLVLLISSQLAQTISFFFLSIIKITCKLLR